MPVMGFVKFKRFFRAAGGADADRNDMKRYLEFVNCTTYDVLLTGQEHAESNGRDIIEPPDLPITAGLQKGLPEIFGGISVALARTLKITGPERAQHSARGVGSGVRIFDLLI